MSVVFFIFILYFFCVDLDILSRRSVILDLNMKCLAIIVIISMVAHQATARPKPSPEDIIKNTINKESEDNEELGGNATDIRGKVKAVDDEYEYDEEYDMPIIEIRFKRENSKEDVEGYRKNLIREKKLTMKVINWSRR